MSWPVRNIDIRRDLDQFGCISDDRNIGSWELVHDNAWEKMPVWIRKGPPGFRNLYSDEVAYVSLTHFSAYGIDGLLEESGDTGGPTKDDEDCYQYFEVHKNRVDDTLRSFGWIL